MRSEEKTDKSTTIEELKELVRKFGKERHWERHHTPKNLAMGIVIEAAELMEHYQWERQGKPDREEVADELADVLFNVLLFAAVENLDLSNSFLSKYKKLQKKYPIEKFNKKTDDLEEYRRIKKSYRQTKK